MIRCFYTVLFTLWLFSAAKTQVANLPLQNFTDPALFNLNDASCINLSGEWLGEEVEYYDNYKSEKGKYNISFILSQEGNKVTGTSLISFDGGTSFGKLKIRGLVAGNKLYFEEYEVVEQKFTSPGVAWCLRTGELDIRLTDNEASLQGANYKGYAAYYYYNCQGAVSMHLHKKLSMDEVERLSQSKALQGANSLQLHPNPANTEVTLTFKITEDTPVRVDLFTLSGELISGIVNDFYKTGTYQTTLSLHTFAAGAYLIRMQTGRENLAKILVISR